jgi:arylsulfatase A-like enzyme
MRALLALLVLLSSWLAIPTQAQEKPNIVLILADDLGINDLSCYGRTDQATPNLDRLAKEGTRFATAYCAQPICSPSRAALMTGKSPARLHLTNFLPGRADAPSQKLLQPVIAGQLPLEEATIAELLRDSGYATACIGKWHLGGAGFGPKEQGFDFAFAGQPNTKPSATEGSKGEYELTAQAEQWMEKQKDRPFFLYLAHNTPHIPFAATDEDRARNAKGFNPAYAAVISHLDACVGRIMAKLDELKLSDRTVLVFASDNGGLHVLESAGTPATHNTPFRAGKGFVYEGGLRVPLIVRGPGRVKAETVIEQPVVLTDLMPTFLELAGIDAAKAIGPLDSASLAKAFTGSTVSARTLFWHFPNYTNQGGRPAGAVRDGEWKLVEQYEDGSVELFNLSSDPCEKVNLAEKEAKRAAELKSKLAAWRKSVGAQEPQPNPEFDAARHRALYVDRDPSSIEAAALAAGQIANKWQDWRTAMNRAVAGRKPRVTSSGDEIRLHAKDATVHGEKLRYEDPPQKNTLGFWTRAEDWASWKFDVATAGKYEIEIQQGCGKGSAGAEVTVEVAGRIFPFTVIETGHFQHFILRTIGVVELATGSQDIALKPKTKPGAAVMDVRSVVLRRLE